MKKAMTQKATLFTDGGHQAVRLPIDTRFEGVTEVEVKRVGRSIVLTPNSGKDSPPARAKQSIAELLAMPGIGEIDFEPPRLEGPLYRPAEFHDGPD